MSDLFLPLYQYLNWQNLEYANNRQTQLQSRLNCLAWNICTRVLILRDLWNLSVVRPKAYTSFYWVNKFTSKSNTYFPNKLTIYSYTFFLQHKELTFRVFLYQILFYFCFVLLLTVDGAKCNVIKRKKVQNCKYTTNNNMVHFPSTQTDASFQEELLLYLIKPFIILAYSKYSKN